MHEDCYSCIKRDICTMDVPKPCRWRYTEDEHRADQASDRCGNILCGTHLPKTYRKKEDNEMKATSTQILKDIIAIDFELQTFPNPDVQDKFIVSATNRDDIFCFVFEGEFMKEACARSGLFTGWEKEQKIRELEKENKKILDVNKELQEKIFRLEKQLNHEKAACNAYYNFFKKYAGEGTELELTYISGSRNNAEVETEYTIVDKEEYKKEEQERMELRKKFIAEVERCTKLRSELIDLEEKNKKLEELKTPTIENFEEPSSRADILDQAKKCVCGHREQDYGSPESNFQLIADLWNDYLFPKLKENKDVISAVDVSMMMALMKVSRIRNGGGSGDSFVDLAGYAACGGELWHLNKGTDIDSNQATDTE